MPISKLLTLITVAFFVANAPLGHAQDAQAVYAEAADRVFQILIIDKNSQEKAAIGSGFQVDAHTSGDEMLIATTFL